MRKSLYLLLFLCLSTLTSFAYGDSFTVRLGSKQDTTIRRPNFNIVIANDGNYKGLTTFSITITNEALGNYLYIFDRPYQKKDLREQHTIIVKDKECQEQLATKCCNVIHSTFSIYPSDNIQLCQIQIPEGEVSEITLPVYVAQQRGWFFKRKVIVDWDLVELNIGPEAQLDVDLIGLRQQYDSITEALSNQQFCRHPNHQPNLEKQKEPFKNAIDDLRLQINIKQKGLTKQDRRYTFCEELKEVLDEIDLTDYEVEDCGGKLGPHKTVNNHRCKYCDKTFEELSTILDKLYARIDNAENPEVEKKNAMVEANAILKCCKNSPKHASDWKSGRTPLKKRIEDSYNRIKNYQ